MTGTVGGPPLRGRAEAAAFVIDPAVIGEAEAIRRVIAAWTPGARVVALPDGAWVLVPVAPIDIRAEQAPGLVATREGPLLSIWRHGVRTEVDATRLPEVDVSGWLDGRTLPVLVLEAVAGAEPSAPALPRAPTTAPDLRRAAGIGADGGHAPPPQERRRQAWLLFGGVVGVLGIAAVLLALFGTGAGSGPGTTARPTGSASVQPSPGPATTARAVVSDPAITPAVPPPSPWGRALSLIPAVPVPIIIGVLAVIALSRQRRAERSGNRAGIRAGTRAGATGGPETRRSIPRIAERVLTRLVRSPAGVLIRTRDERYVLALARAFKHGDYDSALRRAVALGGAGGGVTLRLPRPRLGALTPSPESGVGGGALPLQTTMYAYLHELYGQMAEDLERSGQVEKAAFVLADLLWRPLDAVQLLERHGHLDLAAELAEGRRLDPALAVRLWWQAGRRDRAIDVARLRGVLEEAARRLADVDPEAALALRREWVEHLLQASDLLAALEASWPFRTLRPLVVPHLASGIETGGPTGAGLLAYCLAAGANEARVEAAEELLCSTQDDLADARSAFVTTLARIEPDDRAVDRRLSSAALRCLAAEPVLLDALPRRASARAVQLLRKRADPVLAADLRLCPTTRRRPETAVVTVRAAERPGHGGLVRDAAALACGVLVALGGAGVRLLTCDGREKVQWDIPVDRLVVADHGLAALLLTQGERTVDVHRLDLRTRQVRRWAWLPDVVVVNTFDGAVLPVVDRGGIAVLDTTRDAGRDGSRGVRVLWREFDRGVSVHLVDRCAARMSAVVQGRALTVEGKPELWTWELPGMILRSRRPFRLSVDAHGPVSAVALGAGRGVLALHADGERAVVELHPAGYGATRPVESNQDVADIAAAGPHLALISSTAGNQATHGQTVVDVLAGSEDGSGGAPLHSDGTMALRPRLRLVLPGAARPAMRHFGNVVTVFDDAGRVVAADVSTGRVVANLYVRGG